MGFPRGTSGITQLTSDVTAGPGSGSQAATLVGTSNVESIISANTAVAGALQKGVYDPAGIDEQVVGTTAAQTLTNKTLTSPVLASPSTNDLTVTGLTGATAASRYVGATASGAPTAGTFAVGDFVIDQTGFVWVCTTAGTPGTWTKVGGGGISSFASNFVTTALPFSGASTLAYTTPSLAVGTWLLTFSGQLAGGSPSTDAAYGQVSIVAGTATVTLTGNVLATVNPAVATSGTLNWKYNWTLSQIAVVTVAGTVLVNGLYSDTANNGAIQVAATGIKIA